MFEKNVIHIGNAMEVLQTMPDKSVNCIVTSPPYFGLRDYGVEGQIGLEDTPEAYVSALVGVFSEAKRVLLDNGTLWLNLGDSYAGSGKGIGDTTRDKWKQGTNKGSRYGNFKKSHTPGLKSKDLIGIPWRVAFALQADGWYLRQDIIWSKPNPMPESVTDRCTKAHEYIFLLSKAAKYHYDHEAIKQPLKDSSVLRLSQDLENQEGSDRVPFKSNGKMKAVGKTHKNLENNGQKNHSFHETRNRKGEEWSNSTGTANKRSVWTVTTKPCKEAHFATFPPDLIEPCILAGCPKGGIVLDPFMGAGTTAIVAVKHNRNFVGIELNQEYREIALKRIEALKLPVKKSAKKKEIIAESTTRYSQLQLL